MLIIIKFIYILFLFIETSFAYAYSEGSMISPSELRNPTNKQNTGIIKDNYGKKVTRRVISPVQLGHDSRFKGFTFSNNTVYKILTVYDNPSYIEFEDDELVNTIINPKRNSWQLVQATNRMFVKPLESNADTQITVMTNKRIYFFELYAVEPDKDFDKNYTFYFKFNYPSEDEMKTIKRYARSIMPNLDDASKYNFNYTVSGEEAMYPIKIFDDGEFTYFEFREKGSTLPAVFTVDTNDFESIVNFRMVGQYLVVESISPRFTFRNGPDIVCVFNENLYISPKDKTRARIEKMKYAKKN